MMRTRTFQCLAGGLLAALAIGAFSARERLPAFSAAQGKTKAQAEDKDREAILKSSRDFAQAFAKGDAKAIASFWTENGEYHDESGEVVRGRDAIEKAFAEFFKDKPSTKVEVLIESIRFPAHDLAIEEGILRQGGGDKELPATTLYSVAHLREAGQWKIVVAREWGAGQDRLHDLDWLLGEWKATIQDQEVILSFSKDKSKPFHVGQFTKKAKGKVVSSGTMKIGLDAQRGQLRSWHFDDDGGHGQAVWVRDGNRWVLDSIGVLADGTETAAVNILSRLSPNEVTWRSIDRVMGDEKLPDTVPIKLTRAGK
jgi:uncharacterized protein (TIGR02246 family)